MTTPDDDIDPTEELFGDHTLRRNPFEGMSAEDIAALQAGWKAPRRKTTTPRGKPEKQNQDRIFKHLVNEYGAIPRRVNSGQWHTAEGDVIMGAKAGTSDLLVEISIIIAESIRIGVYFAVETKSNTGTATEKQNEFIARVRKLGGIACVARTPLDVDTAITAWCAELAERLALPVRPARMRRA